MSSGEVEDPIYGGACVDVGEKGMGRSIPSLDDIFPLLRKSDKAKSSLNHVFPPFYLRL